MAAKKNTPKQIAADKQKEVEKKVQIVQMFSKPTVRAAHTIEKWESYLDGADLSYELTKQVNSVANGDMNRPEAMLLSQAHTLDALFNNLAMKAKDQTHMPHLESFLRLAFKAQAQCRQTLETLSTIKNPPVIFAKQANISNGHQQINNGIVTQAENNQKQQNELLEHTHGERLDIRAQGETISVNPTMETIGEIHRG